MRISLLHTIESNQAVFDQAATDAGLAPGQLRHSLRPDLRIAAEQAQGLGAAAADSLKSQVKEELLTLSAGADALIVTCATLGPAIDETEAWPVPVIRADIALASAAAGMGTKIVVLCAAQSAVAANGQLFERYAGPAGASVDVRLVPSAWDLFKSGEMAACLVAVASAAQDAYGQGADVVAFAHPWMAAAGTAMLGARKPLDGASVSLAAARRIQGL